MPDVAQRYRSGKLASLLSLTRLRPFRLLLLFFVLAIFNLTAAEEAYDDPQTNKVVDQYLRAVDALSRTENPIEVDISANVPRLKTHGRMRVIRKISDVGKVTYRVLGFQGDNSVKTEIIARYLQAEQEAQDTAKLQINPANYKFKLRGMRAIADRQEAYVLQVAPRSKRVGLFKGEVWLNSQTYLPVLEKGRFVKNPSIFFKKVDFERDFVNREGSSIPDHMRSTIDTRIVGKVNLEVAYLSPDSAGAESEVSASSSAAHIALP